MLDLCHSRGSRATWLLSGFGATVTAGAFALPRPLSSSLVGISRRHGQTQQRSQCTVTFQTTGNSSGRSRTDTATWSTWGLTWNESQRVITGLGSIPQDAKRPCGQWCWGPPLQDARSSLTALLLARHRPLLQPDWWDGKGAPQLTQACSEDSFACR